jgi:biopolymer transport protein ExbB/TolQ
MQVFIEFMKAGGAFMYPILIVLAIGIAVCIERIIYLQITKSRNQRVWRNVFPLMSKAQFRQAAELVRDDQTAMARIISYGLERARTARRQDDVEMAMDEGLMEATPRLEARTPYIGTLANIATLLGLLGTIFGLIHAFAAVANADPSQKADMLSAAIAEAMNCTAFGLFTAIPLLLLHTYITSMANKITDSMEMGSVKFMNIFRQVMAQQEQKAGDQ